MDKNAEVKKSDKQTVRNRKFNYELCSLLSLAIGAIVGVVLVAFGVGKLNGYNSGMGFKSVDELTSEILELSDKYSDKEDERDKEFDENGFSEKYLQLDEEASEIDEEITKLTNSRYMREEGWHNPSNLGEVIGLAPEIAIGAGFIVAGIVGFFIFRRLNMIK